MSARNEGRSVRCIFCADSPEECQALCGDLSPLQRSRGGIFWVHEECARWASGVTALPPNPDEVFEHHASRASKIECVACGENGAGLGCFDPSCSRSFHYGCAKRGGRALLCEPSDPAAAWMPRTAFTKRGNCLWCCDKSCEQFHIPHAARDEARTYPAHSDRWVFDAIVHAHPAHADAEGRTPWRTYHPSDDVLIHFDEIPGGAPARILKIFENTDRPDDDGRDDLRMDSRRAPQLVVRHGPAPPAPRQLGSCHTSVWLCARPQVQWYQRPGLEALADMPSSRSDELVWV